MWFFDLDGTEQGDLALVAVLIAAVLVIAAVPEQHLSGLGQVLDEFVIENISVFAVSGVDANGRRPGDALGTTKRQQGCPVWMSCSPHRPVMPPQTELLRSERHVLPVGPPELEPASRRGPDFELALHAPG